MRTASGNVRRYLALWFPFLPIDRLRAARSPRSAAPDEPLVVVHKVETALRIASADPKALALGLHPGLALADARARLPALAVVMQDAAADRALLERLADWCERYTPLVARDGDDGLMLDITGCAHLFGGEAALHADLCARVARRGLQLRAAIAGTPDAARAICRYGTETIIATGAEEAAVRRLPVAALEAPAEVTAGLLRAGLKDIAALAERPRAPLAARFGEDLLQRLDRTLGRLDLRITPRRPAPACMVEQAFPEPIAGGEDISAALARLAGELCRSLERRGEGGRHFEAGFFRADGAVRGLPLATARPLRDPQLLSRLLAERLEGLADPLDPGFGFDLIRLAAVATEPFPLVQTRLDAGPAEEDADVAALADRLAARLGPGQVQRFIAEDTHWPERAARTIPFAVEAPGSSPWPAAPPGEPPTRPLHLFDPPQPVETIAEVPDGPPLRFRWRRVLHEVARAEGPERIAPEWWRAAEDALTRDYYRIEDSCGRRFWIFREGLYGRETQAPRWFIHGLFA
jgi:protein ImuB